MSCCWWVCTLPSVPCSVQDAAVPLQDEVRAVLLAQQLVKLVYFGLDQLTVSKAPGPHACRLLQWLA